MSQQHTILAPGSVTIGQGSWTRFIPRPSPLAVAVERFNVAFSVPHGQRILLPVTPELIGLAANYAEVFLRPDIANELRAALEVALKS